MSESEEWLSAAVEDISQAEDEKNPVLRTELYLRSQAYSLLSIAEKMQEDRSDERFEEFVGGVQLGARQRDRLERLRDEPSDGSHD